MLDNSIYQAYLQVDRDGKRSNHPAGRFLIHDSRLHHLEDYYGHLAHIPEGLVDDYTMARIASPPPGVRIASRDHIRAGYHLDLIPEEELQPLPQEGMPPALAKPAPRPPSVWHYHRAGHDQPHVLEANAGKFSLDGNPLGDDEVATILENVKNKSARIRYAKQSPPQPMAKSESLRKDDYARAVDAHKRLSRLESLAGDDEEAKADVAALRQHVFTDPMTGLGNKLAYAHFNGTPRAGVHLGIDLNHFKSINDTFGHHHGDEAIKAFGNAVRDTLNEVAPPGENGGSGHRVGGDEFHVHLPSHEHAAHFAHALRGKLEAIPAVGGTHRLSASIGVGADPHMADAALYEAKRQKTTPAGPHTPSTIPHVLFHSLHPGHEGPMVHDAPAPPTLPPEPEAPKPPAMPKVA